MEEDLLGLAPFGHRERTRSRARKDGFSDLRPYEAVEMILSYGTPRADTQAVARNIMNRFGTLERLLSASRQDLTCVEGMTKPLVDWMLMMQELINAYLAVDRDDMLRLENWRDVQDFLADRWREVHPPESWIIYTDFDNRIITYDVICASLCWWGTEYMRDIVMQATSLGARHAFLVLFMGVERPWLEDWELENMLSVSRMLRAIDVELLDCVLVNEEGMRSMNMEGGMDRIRLESIKPWIYERYCEGRPSP